MEAGNSREITTILKQYKEPTGIIKYTEVFKIPAEERLPSLVEKDFMKATILVVGAITMAFEKMNFKRRVDGVLINNIADEIIDTCGEDNLSLEDLMLFLQGLVRGKYGNVDELSVSRFMNLFEVYRDDRYEAIQEYRENKHLEFKGLGDPDRSVKPSNAFEEHLQQYSEKLQAKNDEIKLLRREAREK
jgi:hypothetical protein